MWLSLGFTTTGGFGPTSGASWAKALGVNPAARTSPIIAEPRIAVQGIAVKRIGFKLFIVGTLQPKSALAKRVRQRIHPHPEIEIRSQSQFRTAIHWCLDWWHD